MCVYRYIYIYCTYHNAYICCIDVCAFMLSYTYKYEGIVVNVDEYMCIYTFEYCNIISESESGHK